VINADGGTGENGPIRAEGDPSNGHPACGTRWGKQRLLSVCKIHVAFDSSRFSNQNSHLF
jgi:hypothetical protein